MAARERRGGMRRKRGPAGLFADLKKRGDWVRYPVNTKTEHKRLLEQAREILAR